MSYDKQAAVYDDIYRAVKNYEDEARRVQDLLEYYAGIEVRTLLDVACGTGLHLQYLAAFYDVTGIDLSPAQLAQARLRLPSTTLLEDDMRSFELPDQVDAITCLFSSIGHLKTVEELETTIANFSRHLVPGGVVLIEPWIMPEAYRPGNVGRNEVTTSERKITRVSRTTRDGSRIDLELEHWIESPEGDDHFIERHSIMMFSQVDFARAFEHAGLAFFLHPEGINTNGRGIFIATKVIA